MGYSYFFRGYLIGKTLLKPDFVPCIISFFKGVCRISDSVVPAAQYGRYGAVGRTHGTVPTHPVVVHAVPSA